MITCFGQVWLRECLKSLTTLRISKLRQGLASFLTDETVEQTIHLNNKLRALFIRIIRQTLMVLLEDVLNRTLTSVVTITKSSILNL